MKDLTMCDLMNDFVSFDNMKEGCKYYAISTCGRVYKGTYSEKFQCLFMCYPDGIDFLGYIEC